MTKNFKKGLFAISAGVLLSTAIGVALITNHNVVDSKPANTTPKLDSTTIQTALGESNGLTTSDAIALTLATYSPNYAGSARQALTIDPDSSYAPHQMDSILRGLLSDKYSTMTVFLATLQELEFSNASGELQGFADPVGGWNIVKLSVRPWAANLLAYDADSVLYFKYYVINPKNTQVAVDTLFGSADAGVVTAKFDLSVTLQSPASIVATGDSYNSASIKAALAVGLTDIDWNEVYVEFANHGTINEYVPTTFGTLTNQDWKKDDDAYRVTIHAYSDSLIYSGSVDVKFNTGRKSLKEANANTSYVVFNNTAFTSGNSPFYIKPTLEEAKAVAMDNMTHNSPEYTNTNFKNGGSNTYASTSYTDFLETNVALSNDTLTGGFFLLGMKRGCELIAPSIAFVDSGDFDGLKFEYSYKGRESLTTRTVSATKALDPFTVAPNGWDIILWFKNKNGSLDIFWPDTSLELDTVYNTAVVGTKGLTFPSNTYTLVITALSTSFVYEPGTSFTVTWTLAS